MDAATIAGMLGEPVRRRTVAALLLGATTAEEVRDATGDDLRDVVDALARLVSGGLVVEGERRWFLLEEAFGEAARSAAPPDEVHEGVDAGSARVLRAFVRDGRLLSIPTQRTKRLVVLDLLAQEFEPGRRYSEAMVNLTLGRWHADTAALRRWLVDEGFLDRAGGQYWRSGGSVPVAGTTG